MSVTTDTAHVTGEGEGAGVFAPRPARHRCPG